LNQCARSISIVILAALSAGLYGAIHDQISYTISPEYYTHIKFKQFAWLHVDLGTRANVGLIGFVATCWFGAICGILVAYRLRNIEARHLLIRFACLRLGLVLATSALVASGMSFYSYAQEAETLVAHWQHTAEQYMISDPLPFAIVAQMHRMSYVGGVIGMFWLLLPVKASG
jgi:hypothetical protein